MSDEKNLIILNEWTIHIWSLVSHEFFQIG